MFKSGYIGILGPTNSGKSCLVNALVGEKVSIVSPRQQTTYHRVTGVLNRPDEQFVFVDTPGFQRHGDPIARSLNRVADRGGDTCDVVLWVFDATNRGCFQQCEALADRIRQKGERDKQICVLNKVDKVKDKTLLLPLLERFHNSGLFRDVIPVSALRKDGMDRLLEIIRPELGEGPQFFPSDQYTDRSQQFLATEYIREAIYRTMRQEVPYAVWIEVESWDEQGPTTKIHAAIHVDSQSRKKILVGKNGQALKEVGTKARKQIEALIGKPVYLKLFVDLQENWRNNKNQVNSYLELDS